MPSQQRAGDGTQSAAQPLGMNAEGHGHCPWPFQLIRKGLDFIYKLKSLENTRFSRL